MKEPSVELRAQVPRRLVDMLDAVSLARGLNRTELLVEVLDTWHQTRVREATLIHRLVRGKTVLPESDGGLDV